MSQLPILPPSLAVSSAAAGGAPWGYRPINLRPARPRLKWTYVPTNACRPGPACPAVIAAPERRSQKRGGALITVLGHRLSRPKSCGQGPAQCSGADCSADAFLTGCPGPATAAARAVPRPAHRRRHNWLTRMPWLKGIFHRSGSSCRSAATGAGPAGLASPGQPWRAHPLRRASPAGSAGQKRRPEAPVISAVPAPPGRSP